MPEPTLWVEPWPDVVLDKLGQDPRSEYVERFWASVLGPSATLLLRRLASELDRHPEGFELDTVSWAQELGIGIRSGRNSPFWRALERSAHFRATHLQGHQLLVRRRMAPLSLRQLDRLPTHLQEAHRRWMAQQQASLADTIDLTEPRRAA